MTTPTTAKRLRALIAGAGPEPDYGPLDDVLVAVREEIAAVLEPFESECVCCGWPAPNPMGEFNHEPGCRIAALDRAITRALDEMELGAHPLPAPKETTK